MSSEKMSIRVAARCCEQVRRNLDEPSPLHRAARRDGDPRLIPLPQADCKVLQGRPQGDCIWDSW